MESTHKKVCHAKSRRLDDIVIDLEEFDFYENTNDNSCVIIVNTSQQDISPVIEALKRYKENEEKSEEIRVGMYIEDISEVVKNKRKI